MMNSISFGFGREQMQSSGPFGHLKVTEKLPAPGSYSRPDDRDKRAHSMRPRLPDHIIPRRIEVRLYRQRIRVQALIIIKIWEKIATMRLPNIRISRTWKFLKYQGLIQSARMDLWAQRITKRLIVWIYRADTVCRSILTLIDASSGDLSGKEWWKSTIWIFLVRGNSIIMLIQ